MAATALGLASAFLVLGVLLPSVRRWRRTGDSGFRGISGRPGSLEWWAGVLVVLGGVGVVLNPALVLVWPGLALPTRPAAQVAGAAVALGGIAVTVVGQWRMGASWRIGVDAAEHTDLVTIGVFRWVRNPVFTGMVAATLGLAAMVPTWLALTAAATLVVGLQLQVRRVEEPHLISTHGERYRRYAARAGRFVPGIGRLR